MDFWSLFLVASQPIAQVLLISLLGAYLASNNRNILTPGARRDLNKIVFAVFTPALMFSSLAKTVTLQDVISWWFMPVNVGLTFLLGGILGWVAVKLLKPARDLEGFVIASCSAGNMGNLLLIVVPAVCHEPGNPFGEHEFCKSRSLSYVAFSMALGGLFLWTSTYGLVKKAVALSSKMQLGNEENSEGTENGSSTNEETKIKLNDDKCSEHDNGSLITVPLLPEEVHNGIKHSNWEKLMEEFKQIAQELKAPPTAGAFLGFLFGAIPWLRVLINGENAPLRFVEDALRLLGDGTVPSVTLILGANLTQGQRKKILKPTIMVAIICVRYVILPIIGIVIIKAVHKMGFLLDDPLYHFMLMIQFTTPPAMAIGTMAELFDVGQDECSVIFLWTYLTAAVALTFWPSVYMWILS